MGLLSRETFLHIAARCPSPRRLSLPDGESRTLSQRAFVRIIALLVLGGGIALLLR